jgi:hypothetical protein
MAVFRVGSNSNMIDTDYTFMLSEGLNMLIVGYVSKREAILLAGGTL